MKRNDRILATLILLALVLAGVAITASGFERVSPDLVFCGTIILGISLSVLAILASIVNDR